jgi:hypothetical protein
MLYIKLNDDGSIKQYPYGTDVLVRDNPETSFPAEFTEELLQSYNVYEVQNTPAPQVPYTQAVHELDPIKVDNVWKQQWEVYDLTQQEIDAKTDEQAQSVRQQRDNMLSATDWRVIKSIETQTPENPEWMQYREDLRNIPQQAGFPWNVVWPTQP